MKHINGVLAFVGLLTISGIAYGYKFDFTNTLRGPVTVRVKHSGVDEPYYYAVLEGSKTSRMGRSYTFKFEKGSVLALTQKAAFRARGGKEPRLKEAIERGIKFGDWEYVGRKEVFCLSQVSVAPFEWDKETKTWEMTDEFYDLTPTFVEAAYFNEMLQAAGALAEGATDLASTIVKRIIQLAK